MGPVDHDGPLGLVRSFKPRIVPSTTLVSWDFLLLSSRLLGRIFRCLAGIPGGSNYSKLGPDARLSWLVVESAKDLLGSLVSSF